MNMSKNEHILVEDEFHVWLDEDDFCTVSIMSYVLGATIPIQVDN